MNSTSRALAWSRLLRLPNVFTAIADVTMGYLIADGGFQRVPVWLTLVLASSMLYLAGMVLNDCYDQTIDSRERPERPLPAGEIDPRHAWRVGWSLLVIGVLLAAVLGFRVGAVALLLATAVWCYDAVAKKSSLGPLVMGGCRALNILMAVAVTSRPDMLALQPPYTPWMVAAGIGVYVAGITWFARDEAMASRRNVLTGGLVLMAVGLLMLIAFPFMEEFAGAKVVFSSDWIWPLLLCVLTTPVWRHAIKAISDPQPKAVQATIKQALVTLISLDAAIALLMAGPVPAMLVFALLIPATILGRFIAMS